MFNVKLLVLTNTIVFCPFFSAFAADSAQSQERADASIEVIKVSANFNATELNQTSSSITVVDQQRIADQGAEHFADLLGNIANLNWSGASSRPRYFQIRGVGEQEEYQGAPNSSVGFIIDDIDLSGLGSIGSLYDLQQVDVLRGPQGTRYGANALAGLIYLKSNDPTEFTEYGSQISFGNDNLRTFSGFSSGAVTDSGNLLYRLVLQQHNQDGYRDNLYLNRDDTNERDEFNSRLKLRWFVSDNLQTDATFMYADFDNGYDNWTLDNNGFDTITDTPLSDEQRTFGSSIKLAYTGFNAVDITSLSSVAITKHNYGYDGDWANPIYWAEKDCGGTPCEYNYTWDKKGKRHTYSQEFRFNSTDQSRLFNNSTDWLVGLYFMRLDEDNDLYSEYNGFPDEALLSHYKANNYAAFGQLDSELGESYQLSTGIRVEHRTSDYDDSNNDIFSPSETMWGGHISVSKTITVSQQAYIRIARGYKAGGFNMTLPVELADKKQFDNETLYNYEIGLKSTWLNGIVDSRIALFYMDRQDQQVPASLQDPSDPQRFILYTDNASDSTNYGAELETNWYPVDTIQVYASVGYLQTEYGDYQYQDGYGQQIDLSGRELAYSPNWTYSLGGTWRHDAGWMANINLNGKSEFYYSDSQDFQSNSYLLVNAKLGYETDLWSIYLWGRNLFDKAYGTRGFYFGNEPDQNWVEKEYITYGDPRQIGITLDFKI